jgi:hypothetical protein
MKVLFQMSAHSKSFKLHLEKGKKINNENKQGFGSSLPSSLLCKMESFSSQNQWKKTPAQTNWGGILTQGVLLVYQDLNKGMYVTNPDNSAFIQSVSKCLWITFSIPDFELGLGIKQ